MLYDIKGLEFKVGCIFVDHHQFYRRVVETDKEGILVTSKFALKSDATKVLLSTSIWSEIQIEELDCRIIQYKSYGFNYPGTEREVREGDVVVEEDIITKEEKQVINGFKHRNDEAKIDTILLEDDNNFDSWRRIDVKSATFLRRATELKEEPKEIDNMLEEIQMLKDRMDALELINKKFR